MNGHVISQTDRARVAICPDPHADPVSMKSAVRLAGDLNLPLLEKPKDDEVDILLVVTPYRLELRVVGNTELRGGRAIAVDLTRLDIASGPGRSLKQPLFKAVGIGRRRGPPPTIMDATAGFGEDAWLLASMGCQVLAVERHCVIAAMLHDTVRRAGVAQPETMARLHLLHNNSLLLLKSTSSHNVTADGHLPAECAGFLPPEVIYLDPMFPPGRKRVERKPLRVLRWLVGQDEDASQLLKLALNVARRRVVVKRPIKAMPLGCWKPTAIHKGKALRYDVYSTQTR